MSEALRPLALNIRKTPRGTTKKSTTLDAGNSPEVADIHSCSDDDHFQTATDSGPDANDSLRRLLPIRGQTRDPGLTTFHVAYLKAH